MSATSFEELYKHYAHNVVVARYTGLDGEAVGVAVECEDCQEVLLDYDNEEAVATAIDAEMDKDREERESNE